MTLTSFTLIFLDINTEYDRGLIVETKKNEDLKMNNEMLKIDDERLKRDNECLQQDIERLRKNIEGLKKDNVSCEQEHWLYDCIEFVLIKITVLYQQLEVVYILRLSNNQYLMQKNKICVFSLSNLSILCISIYFLIAV